MRLGAVVLSSLAFPSSDRGTGSLLEVGRGQARHPCAEAYREAAGTTRQN